MNEINIKSSKKIAVATDDSKTVAGHVGRCQAFLIFETDGVKVLNREIRENRFTHHRQNENNENEHAHHHGVGHAHGHQNLVDGLKDCEAIIFSHGGWRLIEDLKTNNITPILTDEKIADDAVLKYLKGELVINDENVCQGHQH